MRLMTLIAALIVLFVCTVPAVKAASAKRALRLEVQRVEHAKTTLRFFEHHPRLLYRSAWHVRAAAWREVTNAQARVKRGRARIRRLRDLLDGSSLSPTAAIRMVFGPYADQALRVSRCESNYDVRARNGQFLGLFQMGSWERATYGDGATALEQSRAAYRYFVASGRAWGPWECKP